MAMIAVPHIEKRELERLIACLREYKDCIELIDISGVYWSFAYFFMEANIACEKGGNIESFREQVDQETERYRQFAEKKGIEDLGPGKKGLAIAIGLVRKKISEEDTLEDLIGSGETCLKALKRTYIGLYREQLLHPEKNFDEEFVKKL